MRCFGFFSLVLVAVYWINRAVGLFDQLIGDGQSALVFLEFSLLTLPNVIRLVLPIAAFVAAVYVANRLTSGKRAGGDAGHRLFGLSAGAAGAVVRADRGADDADAGACSGACQPHHLAERSAEIAQNVTARFLTDGQFMHPAKGVTLYIREIAPPASCWTCSWPMTAIAAYAATYTASAALLRAQANRAEADDVRRHGADLDGSDQRLSVTRFRRFHL